MPNAFVQAKQSRNTRKTLLHLGYWIIVTIIFLVERSYLIHKAGLPYFLQCTAVRVGLLVGISYLNGYWLMPAYLVKKRYEIYFILIVALIVGYIIIQSFYDYYLYGYLLGSKNQNLYVVLLLHSLNTIWYVVLSIVFKISIDWYEQNQTIRDQPVKLQLEHSEPNPEFIFVKSGVKKIKLYFNLITHIQGLKDYAIIYTPDGKIVVKGSVKQVHELLPKKDFIRVHKSFIVAKNKIDHIERNHIIFDEHQIPIGRNYKEEITRQIIAQ